VADYWAGMTSEETHQEDDVGAPRRDPVRRLAGDMKEHRLQTTDGVEKMKYP
jgi:hypothetical protein